MIGFILRETYRAIRKAKLYFIISFCTMSIGVFLIQASFLTSEYIPLLRAEVAKSLTVQLFLDDDLPQQQLDSLAGKLRAHALVGKCRYISKAQAESLFVKETGEDFRQVLDYNPLPASFTVVLKSDNAAVSEVVGFVAWAKDLNGVNDAGFDKGVYKNVLDFFLRIDRYVMIFALILTAIAFYIIFAMSVVMIDSRTTEIRIMRLVGSSRVLVGAPIVMNGFILGLIASSITAAVWWFLFQAAGKAGIPRVVEFADLTVALKGVSAGLVVSTLSSALALFRLHKRSKEK